MFNALTYKMGQLMKSGKKEAVDEVEINTRQKELDGIIRQRVPEFEDEDNPTRQIVERAKKDFRLEEHPYSNFIAAGAALYLNFDAIRQSIYEEGKKAALNEKAEDNRKKGIKEGQLTPGGTKLGPTGKPRDELTADQLETAKRLGLNTPEKLKLYKTQILRSKVSKA